MSGGCQAIIANEAELLLQLFLDVLASVTRETATVASVLRAATSPHVQREAGDAWLPWRRFPHAGLSEKRESQLSLQLVVKGTNYSYLASNEVLPNKFTSLLLSDVAGLAAGMNTSIL